MTSPDTPTRHPILAFIADCEILLDRHGRSKAAFVGGTLFQDAVVFESPGLTVKKGAGMRLQIDITYVRDGEERRTTNPVVERNEKGELYRIHGEWQYAKVRVASLLAGQTPDTPIHVGPNGQGWSVGLD